MLRQYFTPGEWEDIPLKVVEEVIDPVANERYRRGLESFAKNGAWLQAHLDEILPRIRGKHIAVAGQELFVADTAEEVRAWVKVNHPEDPGPLFQRIPAVRRDFIG
jgi:hypothetical protein